MTDALDVLLGHTEVQRHAFVVDGEIRSEARIVAVDRNGERTVCADWAEPVQLERPKK